eukprot:892696-Pelagomonas_calceolata.AAC.9
MECLGLEIGRPVRVSTEYRHGRDGACCWLGMGLNMYFQCVGTRLKPNPAFLCMATGKAHCLQNHTAPANLSLELFCGQNWKGIAPSVHMKVALCLEANAPWAAQRSTEDCALLHGTLTKVSCCVP